MDLATLTTSTPDAQLLQSHGKHSNLPYEAHQAIQPPSSKTHQYATRVPGLRLESQARIMFGKAVPYYQLNFDHLVSHLDVPAARFPQILQRILDTFNSDGKANEETFALWSGRKGIPFFTELLEDINLVGPDDLPELLRNDLQSNEVVLD